MNKLICGLGNSRSSSLSYPGFADFHVQEEWKQL
jgi:hypothetical protein